MKIGAFIAQNFGIGVVGLLWAIIWRRWMTDPETPTGARRMFARPV